MYRLIVLLLAASTSIGWSQSAQLPKPKLILFVAIDQFRYDYLPRFRDEYAGVLKRLADRGPIFADAHLEHYPAVTAVGHATMLSGATPAIRGIIGNNWYDRETKKDVTSVSDDESKLQWIEGGAGTSPCLNYELMDRMRLDRVEAQQVVAAAMREHPQVARVYTRQQILDEIIERRP